MMTRQRVARPERRTVNLPAGIHEQAQDTAWDDGKITVGVWIAEAIRHYLTLSPAQRDKFRGKFTK